MLNEKSKAPRELATAVINQVLTHIQGGADPIKPMGCCTPEGAPITVRTPEGTTFRKLALANVLDVYCDGGEFVVILKDIHKVMAMSDVDDLVEDYVSYINDVYRYAVNAKTIAEFQNTVNA